ncbi:ATPase [Neisseria wadsworthii 9715]|uniref:ATPase n=1 Tax=Neisseria wadsworthii 9715 TaxID=1030841 RepID=G4CN68_9NEIS|nr:ATPase [Neisseria wadsworthii 9715]
MLLFLFIADWVIIPKLQIFNFLEYFIYYTVLQFRSFVGCLCCYILFYIFTTLSA